MTIILPRVSPHYFMIVNHEARETRSDPGGAT